MFDLELKGKVALVSGASAGIGLATSKILASEGIKLALVARNTEKLQQLSNDIVKNKGFEPLLVSIDLTEKNAPETVYDKVIDIYGHIDIIVNSAGGSRPIPVNAPDTAWDEAFAVNFDQVRKLTSLFLPLMIKQKWGRIINVTGTLEPKGLNAANSAKAAVHAWAKGLSIEVSRYGVTINSISPGRIMSEQIRRLYPTEEDRQRFIDSNIPAGYFGEPEDLAYLITFLASQKARYITGEIIHVDGGLRKSAF